MRLSALGIGVFQVVGSFGASDNQPERKALDALAVVLVLIGPAALAWRDRRPLLAVVLATGAADVYVALGYPYGPVFISVVVALFSAVQAGRRRPTWWWATAGFVGYLVATTVDPRSPAGPAPLHLALVAAWLAAVLAVAEVARTRRTHAENLARAEEEDKQRRAADQRLALAQDLHDVLAHHISLINVQAGVALHLIDDRPDQARPALANIKQASREALGELRAALDLLRQGDEAPRSPAPRLADLDALVATVRTSGLDVRLVHEQPPPPLPAAVELAAYRIIQEALTNVTRHARADTVTVRLGYDTGVTIEVVDDGVGAAGRPGQGAPPPGNGIAAVPRGNGIIGMGERAVALGGTAEAGPLEDGGFRVVAHLPVEPVDPVGPP